MKHSIGALMTILGLAACSASVESDPTQPGDGASVVHGTSDACPEPDGPRRVTPPEELADVITGKWIHCTGPTPFPLDGSAGVEFAADGKYYQLVTDSSGALVRGTGSTSQGTWEVDEHFVLLWSSTRWGGAPLFEDSPRRFGIYMASERQFAVYQLIP
jgi:hypothetical protein